MTDKPVVINALQEARAMLADCNMSAKRRERLAKQLSRRLAAGVSVALMKAAA